MEGVIYDIRTGTAIDRENRIEPVQTSFFGEKCCLAAMSLRCFDNLLSSRTISENEKHDLAHCYVIKNDVVFAIVPNYLYFKLVGDSDIKIPSFLTSNYYRRSLKFGKDLKETYQETRSVDIKYLEIVEVFVRYGELSPDDFYHRGTGKDKTPYSGVFFFENVPDSLIGAILCLFE